MLLLDPQVRVARKAVACGAEKKICREVVRLPQLSALHSDLLVETMARPIERYCMKTALGAGFRTFLHHDRKFPLSL